MANPRLALTLYDFLLRGMLVVLVHVAMRVHPMEEALMVHVMMGVMMMTVLVTPSLNSGRQSQNRARKCQNSESDFQSHGVSSLVGFLHCDDRSSYLSIWPLGIDRLSLAGRSTGAPRILQEDAKERHTAAGLLLSW
jgi:hypothetical protein